MTSRHVAEDVTTSHTYKRTVYQTHLLWRRCCEGTHVRNETVGKLSHLAVHIIDLVRRALYDEAIIRLEQLEIVRSASHWGVQAVLRDKLKVNVGLITNAQSCFVAVDVVDGNVAGPTTPLPQVHRLRKTFGI